MGPETSTTLTGVYWKKYGECLAFFVDLKFLKFCTVKDTINQVKRQPTEWDKTLANHIFVKGLIPRIYKEQFNDNKTNTCLKNGQKT